MVRFLLGGNVDMKMNENSLSAFLYKCNFTDHSKLIFCELSHIKYMILHCPVTARAFCASKRDWIGLYR